MHRPPIPRLSFAGVNGNGRATAAVDPTAAFTIEGRPATINNVQSPTRNKQQHKEITVSSSSAPASSAASVVASPKSLFRQRAASGSTRRPHSRAQQQQPTSHTIETEEEEARHTTTTMMTTTNSNTHFDSDNESDVADYDSQPLSHAIQSHHPPPAYDPASLSSSDESDTNDIRHDAAHQHSPSSPPSSTPVPTGSVIHRRPLRDDSFESLDGFTTEEEFLRPITTGPSNTTTSTTSNAAGGISTRRTRASGGPPPDATEQLAANSSVAAPAARSRVDRGSIRNWILTSNQLRHRADLMERDHGNWLDTRKGWFQPGSEDLKLLQECDRLVLDGNERLRRERETLSSDIRRLKSLVAQFRTHVRSPTDHPEFILQLKRLVDSIEESLSNFKMKAKEKYVIMLQEERDLTSELDATMIGFERWTNELEVYENVSTNGKKKLVKTNPNTSSNDEDGSEQKDTDLNDMDDPTSSSSSSDLALIRNELSELDSSISLDGGSNGGWDPRDHAHFLKLYTRLLASKVNNNNATAAASTAAGDLLTSKVGSTFLARVASEVTNQTPATVAQHLEWYHTYQQRLERKKQLLASWKQAKAVKDPEGLQEEIKRQQEAEKEERKQIHALLSAHRADQAAQVAEWRAMKDAEAAAKAERARNKKEEQERERREKAEEERRRLRLLVESYQDEKAVAALVSSIQSGPSEAEIQERHQLERERRKRMKEQQEEELRRTREKRLAREALTARQQERTEQLSRASTAAVIGGSTVATARDPSRLTQPTQSMVERAKQRQSEEAEQEEYARTHGGRTPGTMLTRMNMGHTATPSWRKGL